jgi:hypothetical protein
MKRIFFAVSFLVLSTALAADKPEAGEPGAPITIKMDAAHPRDVIAEISAKTGVAMDVWPQNMWNNRGDPNLPTSISINAEGKSFWEVMQQLCDQAHLRPFNMGSGNAMTLQQSSSGLVGKRPTFASPTAMVVVESIQRNHTIQFDSDDPQPHKACGVSLNVWVDPRLRMIRYGSQPNLEEAKDENGTSLLAASVSSAKPPQNFSSTSSRWELPGGIYVPLDYDPEKSKKLASLKGAVTIMVASEVETFEVDLADAKGEKKEIAGIEFSVSNVKQTNRQTNAKVTVVRKDASKEQFEQLLGDPFSSMSFVTANGTHQRGGGGGGGSDSKREYNMNVAYGNANEKPVKFVWEIPTKTDEQQLSFEFKDLPLP